VTLSGGLAAALTVIDGGSGASSFNRAGVLYGNAASTTGALASLATVASTARFLRSGGTNTAPSWDTVSQADTTDLTTASTPTFNGLTLTGAVVSTGASNYIEAAASTPTYNMVRVNGTFASPAVVGSGDVFGIITARGQFDTTPNHFATAAQIQFVATQAFAGSAGVATALGSRIDIYTVPNSSATNTLAVRIGSDQSMKVTGSFGMFNVAPAAQTADPAAAPAGGTGTAAGGWDTAAHRDSAIATINACRNALRAIGAMA
jgi:hypothetical protein